MDNNQQPTGYNFDVNGKLLKEHECSICLHLIRNATELPCSDLMCRDCLLYYEEKELEQNENADFRCPLCRTVYDRSQKKQVRSTDKTIRQSLEVKCKNWKCGCGWVGCISNYEDHHNNVCKFLIVECPNNGCMELIQRRLIERHQESCKYRIVPCEHCETTFPMCQLGDHHESCPSYPVSCQNFGCKEIVQRKQMDNHCKKECQHQMIPCIYYEVGCTVQLPRHAMTSHHQETMQHHSFLLLKSHVHLSKKNQDLEKQLKKSNETIEQLQETVMKQEESIERQQAEITCLQNDVKKDEERAEINECNVRTNDRNVKEKLNNLETVAKTTADLFQMISKIELFKEGLRLCTLNQKDYDGNEYVQIMEAQAKENEDEKANCYYLKSIGEAVKSYQQMYFPKTFKKRVWNVTLQLEKDDFCAYGKNKYLKTEAHPCKTIYFKAITNYLLFEEEMKKNTKWNRRSLSVASYFDNTMYRYHLVLLLGSEVNYVMRLLHNTDEKKSTKLTINDITTIIDFNGYRHSNNFFIFQIKSIN